jgi:hypothetical protein
MIFCRLPTANSLTNTAKGFRLWVVDQKKKPNNLITGNNEQLPKTP